MIFRKTKLMIYRKTSNKIKQTSSTYLISIQWHAIKIQALVIQNRIVNITMEITLIASLIILTTTASFSIGSSVVNIQQLQHTRLSYFNGSIETCGKLIGMTQLVYHLSENVFSMWNVSNVEQSPFEWQIIQNASSNIIDFDVNSKEQKLCFLDVGNQSKMLHKVNTSLNLKYSKTFLINSSLGNSSQIFIINSFIYTYYKNTNSPDKISKNSIEGSAKITYTLQHSYSNAAFTPDFSMLLAWTNNSQIYIYEGSSFELLYIYNQSMYSTIDSIQFNSDSSLAVFYSNSSSIKVISLINFATIFEFNYTGNITSLFFILNNSYIVVSGSQGDMILDPYTFQTSKLQIGAILADKHTYNYDSDNLFTCSEGILYKYAVSLFVPEPNQNIFYQVINLTETQQQIVDVTGNALSATTQISQKVIIMALSTPLTFYFLGFLNYFNLCSQYILLNQIIPDQVYYYLNQIYQNLNTNFFSILGLNLNVPKMSKQTVTRYRPAYYGISSDLLYSDNINVILFLINILCFQLIFRIASKLNKTNLFRRLIVQNKEQIYQGQAIALILPLTLPWIFIIWGGVSDFSSKINLLFQYLCFFFCIFYQILYFFSLLKQNKQRIKISNKVNYQNGNEIKMKQSYTFASLITVQIIQAQFTCFCNFIYPFLILLQTPDIFHIIIGCCCLCSLKIAFSKKQYKINSIILAIYPFVFHLCFIIFYNSSNETMLIYAQLTCLIVLLMGSVHHFLVLIISILHYLYSKICRVESNKINPLKIMGKFIETFKKRRNSQNSSKIRRQQNRKVCDIINSNIVALSQMVVHQSKLKIRIKIVKKNQNKLAKSIFFNSSK